VRDKLLKILAAGGLSLLLISSLSGQVIPTDVWVDFYGSATMYNGNAIPVGSIIDAYDPDGVYCGSDTVTVVGKYGFMPVYGDDSHTDGIDEGAQMSDLITFRLNGRQAVTHGPDAAVWDGLGGRHEVNLSASAIISIAGENTPNNQYALPGDTVRYFITVRNTGEGIDFYKVFALSSNGWIIHPQFGFSYALPGGTATVYFDLYVPTLLFDDTTDLASFRVCSGIDTTVCFEGSVTTYIGWTDIPGETGHLIPEGFQLYQNAPNPFNSITSIAFDLPFRCDVEIIIYDLLGRKVDAFDLGMKSAGHHTFEYSANALASGIYLYRVRAGEASDIKKMVLLK
jgi:Secretion system C-terminal sorting domain